jgi:hypothetical protein
MQPCAHHTNERESGPGRIRRAAAMAVVLVAADLLLAACSLPGQAAAVERADHTERADHAERVDQRSGDILGQPPRADAVLKPPHR